jgi:sugar lactone lactonase YvrE
MPHATLNLDPGGHNIPTGIAVGPGNEVYVANQPRNCHTRFCYEAAPGNVSVYPAGSDGNAKPSVVIRGHKTKLAYPSAIAVDHSGNIYVANEGPPKCLPGCGCVPIGPASITVYAPDSKGDTRPISTIRGASTELGRPYRITVDSSGNIYVLTFPGVGGFVCFRANKRAGAIEGTGGSVVTTDTNLYASPILIFAAGSNGDVPPIGAIGGPFTGSYGPTGIAIGPSGP